MKKIILFVLSLAAFVGCRPEATEEVGEPSLELMSEESLSIGPDGGQLEILFKLDNPKVDGRLNASSKEDWIESITISETEGKVQFSVLPNEERLSRTATVKVSYLYDGGADYFNVTVLQDGMSSGNVKVSVKEVMYTEAKALVESEDESLLYVVRVVPKSVFEGFESDQALFDSDMEYFKKYSEDNGMSLKSVIEKNGGYGTKEYTFDGLDPDTEYSIYSYGVLPDFTMATELSSEHFSTKTVEMSDCILGIELDLDDLVANVKVTPTDNNVYYYFNIIEPHYLIQYGNTTDERVKNYIANLLRQHVNYGGTNQSFLDEKCFRGAQSFSYDKLTPVTEYLLFGVGMNEYGLFNTEVYTESFTTEQGGNPADLTVEFEVSEVGPSGATVKAIPSDNFVLYHWDIALEDVTPEEEMQLLEDYATYNGKTLGQFLKEMAVRGVNSQPILFLEPDTKYKIFYIGLKPDGEPATDVVFNGEFTTLPAEEGK